MAVDVTGQHGREFGRHVGVADHVLRGRESEVGRADRRALGGLVYAQHAHGRGVRRPLGVGDQLRELRADVATLARESGQGECRAAGFHDERPRSVEDVDVRMRGESGMRQKRALVIPRNDEHRHAAFGHAPQRLERLVCERRHNGRTVEHVAAMHDDVDLPIERRLERRRVVGQEVVTASPPLDARAHGKVEPEVGIGDEQDPDVRHHGDTTLVGVSSVV